MKILHWQVLGYWLEVTGSGNLKTIFSKYVVSCRKKKYFTEIFRFTFLNEFWFGYFFQSKLSILQASWKLLSIEDNKTKIYKRITNVIVFVWKIPWFNPGYSIFSTIPVFPATLILRSIASLVWVSDFPTGV